MKTKFYLEFLWFMFLLYMFVAYIVNLIQLISCDWTAPYKEEVIHLLGAFIFPVSMITCWY
jgi:hypothetical protein